MVDGALPDRPLCARRGPARFRAFSALKPSSAAGSMHVVTVTCWRLPTEHPCPPCFRP